MALFYILVLLPIGAFLLTDFLVPRIINVVKTKHLMDAPNGRSSHEEITPNMGGIAFYICVMISFYFLDYVDHYNSIHSIVPGLTIMFIIGLKDDLTVLSARVKLISQIISCLFLLSHFKFAIYSLNGFLGINNLNPYLSFLLALVIMLAIINAYNLIDGIDGLASIIGLIVFALFGAIFFLAGAYLFAGLSFIFMGCLSAFLLHNISKKNKIFMGDTGSMLIGFVLAAMTIRLLAFPLNILDNLGFIPANLPLIIASILILPLFDMIRVMIVRLSKGKSPFSPDRNHIHHLLCDKLHLTHVKTSLIMGAFNLLFASLIIFLSTFMHSFLLLAVFLFGISLFTLVLAYIKKAKFSFQVKESEHALEV
jgi:UDP-N-acetylmuramyl pentapeptide phosphotransferase/UDP-N-acetylglucosamine-1-phosphate transferase